MSKLIIAILLLTTLCSGPVHADEPPFDEMQNWLATAVMSGKPTVLFFEMQACESCQKMKSVAAQLARTHGVAVNFVVIDIQRHPALLDDYDISAVPAQVFLDREGEIVIKNEGFMGRHSAERILRQLLLAKTGQPSDQ